MVVATAVLFYVSYWLLSKMEVVKWNHFVKSKVHDAVTSGSSLALASAAFLAVYREGFETVLFYKALIISAGGATGPAPIAGGILLGAVLLVGVYLGINRFGVRLPLKPFFAVTSGFLYYMAFVFAGSGIAELQEGGFVPMTPIHGAPRLPAVGIYPTAETLGAQTRAAAARADGAGVDLRAGAAPLAGRAARVRQGRGMISTADICDRYGDRVSVAEPLFRDFGQPAGFTGRIETVARVRGQRAGSPDPGGRWAGQGAGGGWRRFAALRAPRRAARDPGGGQRLGRRGGERLRARRD